MAWGAHHRPASVSRKSGRAHLAMLLAGCRAEQLNGFTAAGLASTHNVPVAEAERMLAQARQGRLV
jgi:hypothetical protein